MAILRSLMGWLEPTRRNTSSDERHVGQPLDAFKTTRRIANNVAMELDRRSEKTYSAINELHMIAAVANWRIHQGDTHSVERDAKLLDALPKTINRFNRDHWCALMNTARLMPKVESAWESPNLNPHLKPVSMVSDMDMKPVNLVRRGLQALAHVCSLDFSEPPENIIVDLRSLKPLAILPKIQPEDEDGGVLMKRIIETGDKWSTKKLQDSQHFDTEDAELAMQLARDMFDLFGRSEATKQALDNWLVIGSNIHELSLDRSDAALSKLSIFTSFPKPEDWAYLTMLNIDTLKACEAAISPTDNHNLLSEMLANSELVSAWLGLHDQTEDAGRPDLSPP